MWLLLLLVGPVLLLIILRLKGRTRYTLVDGRVFIEGKQTHRGLEVFIGTMKTEGDMFSVDPIIGSNGTVLITSTSSSGDFKIRGVPLGSYWLVARNPGYRTFMKPIIVDLWPRCPVGDLIMRR
ncbi:MAG: carboxypeptidase-like regulatory domain-containing protein [bacterium]|nr:carboxypeptidase-like regulatory domain-containing protein [bacterium]|tara:strand:- start:159 stop:530 length:372 start_codon:yes stop_codon:yes gene_type:complete